LSIPFSGHNYGIIRFIELHYLVLFFYGLGLGLWLEWWFKAVVVVASQRQPIIIIISLATIGRRLDRLP
jgi:hypothetical protein